MAKAADFDGKANETEVVTSESVKGKRKTSILGTKARLWLITINNPQNHGISLEQSGILERFKEDISSRIRIAKGLSVGSSNVHVTPTRETYWEKTPCRFFVTDKRFIAISQKGGFNLKADKIIDMKLNADAVTLYTGSKTYIVFMTSEDVHRYKELWETIQSLQRNGIDPKKLLR